MPKIKVEKMIHGGTRLEPRHVAILEAEASRRATSRTELIREIIIRWIKTQTQ